MLKRIIENAPLEKSPENDESLRQMRNERTEAARIAKKVKASKKNWSGKKRTSSHSDLPSIKELRNGKMTDMDRTLDQQFVYLNSD